MDTARSALDGHTPVDVPQRILVAVHGHEPAGWETEVHHALTRWPRATIRVLGVLDPPTAAFTGPLPLGRSTHAAATREWRRLEEERVGRRLVDLTRALPAGTEGSLVHADRADPGRTIARWAGAWDATLVVVGPDGRAGLGRRLLGAIHERVVAHARCGVLVTPAPRPVADRATGRAAASVDPGAFGGRRTAAAGGEA